jgi:cell division protein FtsB
MVPADRWHSSSCAPCVSLRCGRIAGGWGDNVELISSAHNQQQFQVCVTRKSRRADDLAAAFRFLGITQVDKTSEAEHHIDAPSELKPLHASSLRKSSRRPILALAIFALGVDAAAAVYSMSPADFTLPDVGALAELIPLPKSSEPTPDPVLAALKDIQSAQQQHLASLQENNSSLQQNAALLQQDSLALVSLRQSVTDERSDVKKISAQIADEHVDVKKMSGQISTLIAKVDSLQNALSPEFTSSIPSGRARSRLSLRTRRAMARQLSSKPFGPVSVGGAPLTVPAVTAGPQTTRPQT